MQQIYDTKFGMLQPLENEIFAEGLVVLRIYAP